MNKIKFVQKQGYSQLEIKSAKGQQLIEHEIHTINNDGVRGLLKIRPIVKGSSFKLVYDMTGFISFGEYLQTPLTKDIFANILRNILKSLNSVQSVCFKQENLLLDFDKVMINPASHEILFVYVPVQGFEMRSSLREFLLNIIQFGSFVPGEDNSYVKDYILILNTGINFSVFDLEEYIKSLSGGKNKQNNNNSEKECPSCRASVPAEARYCPKCSAKLTGNTGDFKNNGVYDPFSSEKSNRKSEPNPVKEERQPPKKRTQGLSDSTQVLNTYDLKTMPLDGSGWDVEEETYPYLIREKTSEKIEIDSDEFLIGKDEYQCNYAVPDNRAVSRLHAKILTKGYNHYIYDNKSTNGTFVDGRRIAPETEVEIFDKTQIRFANEDFTFYIE